MRIVEFVEQLKAMPEKMEGFNSEGEMVVLDTAKVADALVKSLRNCDVGTAEEQFDRHETFCKKYFRYSMANPCAKFPNYKDGDPSSPCVFRFLQMPYGEGGAR